MSGKELWRQLYPCLTSREWLLSELRAGKSGKQIAREIGCGDKTVYKALKIAGLSYPIATHNNKSLAELEQKIPK
ncbi:hypothetical protein J6C36_03765 [Methanocorpusculaceae archaeon]|nr:hypothetical protein [Methanocorpusculaceae archaeon]MBO5118636.1 hypothetical protein [Methanocorpusculum sp.]MBO5368604.1 hypothetical protein [Methanocorpusculum sp.]MBO5430671.1 hypothetical protein [Methanocorpusculum sp.]MBP3443109.1 hypothetical protein [Methanocorpusculaceae archaeon]